jgi:hypothetical protein
MTPPGVISQIFEKIERTSHMGQSPTLALILDKKTKPPDLERVHMYKGIKFISLYFTTDHSGK